MEDFRNILIQTWTEEARDFVLEQALTLEFDADDWLCRDGENITHFIFPHSGILVASAAGLLLEMKATGWEGFVGIPSLLAGGDCGGDVRGLVAGVATLVPCTRLHDANQRFPSVAYSLRHYGRFAVHTLMQTVSCVRSQSADNIVALWLLTAAVRLRNSDIPITHETLANLLGLRRATVTTTLSKFSKEGLLDTGRGMIHISNMRGLEAHGGQYFRKWQNSLAELTAELPHQDPPVT